MKARCIAIVGPALMLAAVAASLRVSGVFMADLFRRTDAKVVIAVCPTFLPIARHLDAQAYTVLPTRSTAESMALLADGTADVVLAGRALKPQEPLFPLADLGSGYSWITDQESQVYVGNLGMYSFVTDLDPTMIQTIFGINDIRNVSDVYAFLGENIAITNLENTDYARAAPVHLLGSDGSRMPQSRTPVLYCMEECPQNLSTALRNLLAHPHS